MGLGIILVLVLLLATVSYCQDLCTDFNAQLVYSGGIHDIFGHRIKSNGFPDHNYKSDTDECWEFSNVNESDTLEIEFKYFKTQACCDTVLVYDEGFANESTLIAELAGTEFKSGSLKYRSTGSHLFVWFKSDSSDERRGWQACICPSVSSVCVCLWQTAYPFTTTKSPNSWSSWDSGAQGVTKGVKTDTITGAVVSVIVVTGIIVTVCGACGYKRRARRRATTTGTHVTLMRPVDTTNLPPGTYPVQHRVSYTANQAGVPLVSQPMSVQQNMQQQPIPDSMQVPSYDSALSYPTPNHTADETSESEPPLYSVETDHQTSPTTESSTRHTDSSDITHSGGSASPDQEATSLPPSYDQLYS